jgi:TRAP transporter TAXI family solute receptor
LTRRQFVVALTLPALLRTSGVGAQTGRTTLSLATAGPGSAFLGFARAVAPVVAKRVPVDLDIRQTNGSNENAELVNSGQVPIATLNLGPGYDAWNGRGQFAGRTLRDIRAVIPMYETPFATIALKEEGIGALRDLAHKRVGVGPVQGPGEVFFRGLADGLGLKPTVVTGSPTDLVQKLLAREIDAFWYGAGLPSLPFVEIASKADTVVFGFQPDEVETMRRLFPYFSPFEIPANVYIGQSRILASVAVWNFVVAHVGTPESVIYELTCALLDGATEIAATFKAAATMSAQNVGTNTFMPFHPGAVRAFRERGVPLSGAALSRLDEIRTQGPIHGTAASARVMDSQATAAR